MLKILKLRYPQYGNPIDTDEIIDKINEIIEYLEEKNETAM